MLERESFFRFFVFGNKGEKMDNLEKFYVNGQVVWRGRLDKVGGVIQKEKPRFVIRPLNKNDAEDMGKLSETIYNHLATGEECFIHKHNQEYYNNVFENDAIHYIGVFLSSKLIGMSYIRLCNSEETLAEELPNSPANFFDDKNFVLAAALGADSVHPDYRGNHLNQIMIACRLEYAKELGCSGAFSIIDRSNRWNMPPYFNNDFHMFATAIDPSDGGKIALMHHNMKKNKKEISGGIEIPFNRFELIDKLLDKGYIGQRFDKDTGFIKFVPTKRSVNEIVNNQTAVIFVNKGARCV